MVFPMLLPIILSVVLMFLLNFTLYYPIIKAYAPVRKTRRMILILLLLLSLVLLGGELARRLGDVYWLSYIGHIWLGILAISFTVMLLNLLVLLVNRPLFRLSTSLSLLLILLLTILAIYNHYKPPDIIEYDIYSDKLSGNSDGFRLVLVSDFHLENHTSKEWLARTIDRINRIEPDALVITGDLIDERYDRVAHLADSFRRLETTYGVYSVPGNHDYYGGLDSYFSFTDRAGLTDLINDNIQITDDIILAGVTDPTAEFFNREKPDVKKAMKKIDNSRYTVFLSHQPIFYEQALNFGADLILAGHTHRGQIPPMTFLFELYHRYPYGFYEENSSIIYTTSGINGWGPPMRLFSRNEIVVFNLYSR